MRYCLFAAVMCLACADADAQRGKVVNADSASAPKEMNIGEVVITGQYKATSTEKAVQRIEIIDRKKIDAMAAQNLRDVLTNQLEIRVSNDPIFGSAMSMQGSQAYGADPKILIDGVPVVGKQNGAVDLSQINLANIERIEIIKGPMSVSYGTDAIAGTVNLITRKTVKDHFDVRANTYYETIGTYNANLSAGIMAGKHTVRLDGTRNFFGGWNPTDGPAILDFRPRLADTSRALLWKPREQYQGCLQYIYTQGKTTINYKGNYFYELITGRGVPLAPYYEMAFDNYFHTYRKDNAVFINSEVAKDKNMNLFVAYNAYKRRKQESSNDLTTLTETFDPSTQDTSKYNEINSRGAFSTSNKEAKVNYEAGYDINMQYANSTQIDGRTRDMGNYAVYGSIEYKPVARLTIRPGVRYGYNTRYTAPLVPSVNFLYNAGNNWMLRASYARGFRQPGLKELYFDFVDINHNIHGNPGLKAEYSNNYSASIAHSGKAGKGSYKLNISGFYNDVQDCIILTIKEGGMANEYYYANAARFRTRGVQSGADYSIKSVSLSAGVAYTGTYNDLSEVGPVPVFSYSPEVRSSAMYTVKRFDLSVSVFYKYTGPYVSYVSSGNDILESYMDGYNTADITFSKYFFKKHLNISAGCKNLFDVMNVAANQPGGGHSTGGNMAAVGTGRFYFLKTEINFSK